MKASVQNITLLVVICMGCFIASAQPLKNETYLEDSTQKNGYNDLLFNSLASLELVLKERFENWCTNECQHRRYVGITHVPAYDFNIYLTVNESVSPTIKASLEISLNYAGVMNVKSLILLRKKVPAEMK